MKDNRDVLQATIAARPVSLGAPPWSRNALIEAYFKNFTETRRLVELLPGGQIQGCLDSLGLSLDVFKASTDELLQSIDAFRRAAREPGFHSRVRQPEFDDRQLRVRRALFAASAAAMALVDHTRVVQGIVEVPDYQERIDATFKPSPGYRLVQEIRNCVTHVRLLPAD